MAEIGAASGGAVLTHGRVFQRVSWMGGPVSYVILGLVAGLAASLAGAASGLYVG
jgi:predicted lysophospholipase L1 biosynthesis ABC-type transport system permease subunit